MQKIGARGGSSVRGAMVFQPLVPVRPVVAAPLTAATASPPRSAAPPRQRKVFQGLAISLPALPCNSHLPQGNSHLPRGSVPSGARPPPDAAQLLAAPAQGNSHLPRGSVPSGARPPPEHAARAGAGAGAEPAPKRRKTAIPSFSLDDSPPSSPAPATAAAAAPAAAAAHSNILKLEVAGVKFYQSSARAAAHEGAAVVFKREPDNRYDQNAMRICADGPEESQLGHVPRATASFLAPLIDGAQICLQAGKILKVQHAANGDCKFIEVSVAVVDIPNAPQPGAQLDDKRAALLKALEKARKSHNPAPKPQLQDAAASASRAPTPQQQKQQGLQGRRQPMQAPQPQPQQHAHTRQRQPEPGATEVSAQQQQDMKQQAMLLARQQAQDEQVKRHKKEQAFEVLPSWCKSTIKMLDALQLRVRPENQFQLLSYVLHCYVLENVFALCVIFYKCVVHSLLHHSLLPLSILVQALDTSPLYPSISAADMLSQDSVCPPPIRWELVLPRGGRLAGSPLHNEPAAALFWRFSGFVPSQVSLLSCSRCPPAFPARSLSLLRAAAMRTVDDALKLWQIAALPLLPMPRNYSWTPEVCCPRTDKEQ